ncbi:MAG: hypothetical protein NT023_10660 [Armatimonadetes bacterium]|nr:hypothetical protein [Armatimonadota bacterium]
MELPVAIRVRQAVILDATVVVSLASKEKNTYLHATAAVNRYIALNCDFFAPGVLVSETLFTLCRMKENDKTLTNEEHRRAVKDFHTLYGFILPPPNGEADLIFRAETIRGDYTCYRSADSIYIALAQALSETRPATLLTLDEGLQKQATRNASGVIVELIDL